jgi:hypothetical protein
MEGDIIDGLGTNEDSKHLQDEHETVVLACPDVSASAVEQALAQYADSIEMLCSSLRDTIDHYTRGFVAGIRAANKVAANVIRP